MKTLLIIFCFFSYVLISVAQISEGGKPLSFKSQLNSTVPVYTMPVFDLQKMLVEDEQQKGLVPLRFAKDFQVDYTPDNSGVWETLDNGDKIWRIGFYSEGALSLNFIFGKYYIPDGAKLFIYNEKGSQILGAFTSKNNSQTGKLATSLIDDEIAIIEYYEPKNVKFNGELLISKVNHGYRPVFSELKDGSYGSSGSCNVDINCSEGSGWQTEKHAVCRIIMGGTSLCSGSLINNTANDGTPYFLTANHCTGSAYDEWVFYFNYESPSCNGGDGSISQTISGCSLKATTTALDFCLVQLSSKPPQSFAPYYAGWNKSSTASPNATCIHHPAGDVKKISKENNVLSIANYGSGYDYNSHWLISHWEVGTTEGGSSGSPLFDNNHRIIGNLTGGEAACGNSVNDYYNRFDLSWDRYSSNSEQLKHWLDPSNTGVTYLNGFDPYQGTVTTCDTLTNIGQTEDISAYTFTSSWGYWTGHNQYGFSKFADRFITNTTKYLSSIEMAVSRAYSGTSGASIVVKIWDNQNSLPSNVLASKSVVISGLTEGYWNTVVFDNPVEVSDTFYVGYEINYGTPVDTFVVYQALIRGDGGLNTAYVDYGGWTPFYNLNSSFTTSLAINITLCSSNGVIEQKEKPYKLNVYPNPANSILNIVSDFDKNISVQFFNLYGQSVLYYENIEPISVVDISNLSNGIYMVEVKNGSERIIKKIIVSK